MTQVALGEICTFIGGGTPSRKCPEYFTGDIPWATVKDFKSLRIDDTEEHVTSQAIDESAANIVEPGTVLLVTRVGLGKVAIAGARLAINQDIKAVISNDSVLPEFLFWFLMSQSARIQAMGTGATVKGVTLHDVRAISMPLPPLPEQRRIVDLLSRAEGIVRLRREAQRKAAELVPALFVDMFGDPASNPKGWQVVRLGDLAEKMSDGPFGSNLKSSHYVESGVRVIRLQNIGVGELIDNDKAFVSEEHYASLPRHHCRPGDVVIGTLGDPNLRAFVMPDWLNEALNKADCVQFRCKSGLCDATYICGLMNMPATLSMASAMVQGITRARISMGRLRELVVPNPPIALQEEFATKVKAVQSIVKQQVDALAAAQATLDALLHQSFAVS